VWVNADPALPNSARSAITQATDVLVSAASAWEMAIKANMGRLPSALDLVVDFEGALAKDGFRSLSITARMASTPASSPALTKIRLTVC